MDLTTALTLVFVIFNTSTGERTTVDVLASDLARNDVVFLGEEHDNNAGHAFQLEILEALHAERPDLVLSLEMFERDVQGALDDYLRGRIDEDTFLANARPWPNYAEHYRPLLEYARENGLDVIAANVPRKAAMNLSRNGKVGTTWRNWVARSTTAPADRYLELFEEAMTEHPGIEKDDVRRAYRSQCLKDDTMAESIADYWTAHDYRRPLIVHVNGKFHSDYGLGTVTRLQQRLPLLRTAVLTMEAAEDPEAFEPIGSRNAGHWVVAVTPEPEEEPVDVEEVTEGDETTEEETEESMEEAAPPAGQHPTLGGVPLPRSIMGFRPDGTFSGTGVAVDAMAPDGPADKAGILVGDVILAIDGRDVADLSGYAKILAPYDPGEVVEVTVMRDKKPKTLKLTLGARP